MRRILGILTMLLGVLIGGWVLVSIILKLPINQGRSPIGGIVTSILFIRVGWAWTNGQTAR